MREYTAKEGEGGEGQGGKLCIMWEGNEKKGWRKQRDKLDICNSKGRRRKRKVRVGMERGR